MSKPCTLLAAAGLALLVGLTGADRPSILPAAALAAPPTTSSAEQWKEARWAIEYNQFDVIARLLTAGLAIEDSAVADLVVRHCTLRAPGGVALGSTGPLAGGRKERARLVAQIPKSAASAQEQRQHRHRTLSRFVAAAFPLCFQPWVRVVPLFYGQAPQRGPPAP